MYWSRSKGVVVGPVERAPFTIGNRRSGGLLCARRIVWGSDLAPGVVAGLLVLGCSPAVSNPPPATVGAGGATVIALPAGVRVTQLALGNNDACGLLESGAWRAGGASMGWDSSAMVWTSSRPSPSSYRTSSAPLTFGRTGPRLRQDEEWRGCMLGGDAYGQANPQFDATLTSAPTPWGAYESGGEPPKFTPANVLRVPTSNDAAAGVQSLSLGYGHGCGTYQAGSVKCWGDARRGQLGVAALRDAFEVQTIAGLPALVEVASARFYSCGRAADGDVWCWELNEQAQLGSQEPGPSPRQVPGVASATSLQLAANRACARLGGGQVICWGDSLDCGEDHQQGPAVVPEL